MNEWKKPIRVLSVTPSLSVCGGIESYSLNYLKHLSPRIKMDFVTHGDVDEELVDVVEARGGRVFKLPPFSAKKLPRTLGLLRRFFMVRGHRYDIVHCNMANAGCFYFHYAKQRGIPVLVLHSHQSQPADTFSHAARNIPLLAAAHRMCTHRIACSKKAGDFLFPDKDHYTIIKNAIDLKRFAFDPDKRNVFRREHGLGDATVLINVGRLTEQKNQTQLLDVMKELTGRGGDYKLVIVGEGHLEEALKKKTKKLGLTDRVIFTGSLSDVTGALCAADLFVLPSLYEGLPVSLIEAEANGLPALLGDGISEESDLTGRCTFLNVEDIKEWADRIEDAEPTAAEKEAGRSKEAVSHAVRSIRAAGYDIRTEAVRLEEYYYNAVAEAYNR